LSSAATAPEVTAPRRAAFEVLRRVFEHGAWADRALPAAVERHELAGRERAQAQRLAYGAVQRRGTSDHFVERLADRPVGELDAGVLAALRLGLFELLYASATPDHAAVSQAVELAKGDARGRRAAGLVNAVLRRAAREGEELLGSLDDSTPAGAALAHSHPQWIAEMWWRELGAADARALMAAGNEPPETALRVNLLRADPVELAEELVAAGAAIAAPRGPGPAPAESLVVDGPLTEPMVAAIESGLVVPQSRASAAVAAALDPQPGERVLDLCAGPGIKTTQIAARMGDDGEVVAVELDERRAAQIGELSSRLEAHSVRPVVGDARDPHGGGYDRVLVDPSCSDLGTLASRPDARWRKTREQVADLASLQSEILAAARRELTPGGTLVYSTCTISERENEQVVAASGLEPDGEPLRTRPDRDATDGFFVARLRGEP
jgi:16S rRNA (cytosine967-C5)-methyltransferase